MIASVGSLISGVSRSSKRRRPHRKEPLLHGVFPHFPVFDRCPSVSDATKLTMSV